MRQFLTPDNGDGAYLCRRLRFRAELAGYITGTLERMTHPSEWEAFGTMTPDEAAGFALDMLNEYADWGDRCMIGDLWVGITADYPDGVLPFDGTQYLRTDYPTLYAVIDAAFIDDADHFTLHEAAGRALVIAGSGAGLTARAVGDIYGVETVTLSEAEIPSHVHTDTTTGATLADPLVGTPLPVASVAAPSVTGATGGGAAHENVPPSFAVKVGVWVR